MSPLAFDHVAVAVQAIADSVAVLELLIGETCSSVIAVESQGVRVAFVGPVELLEPTGPESTVARFLERRGPGLHHIAFRTPDIRAEMRRLVDAGVELIDPEPRRGAHGLVAFAHPRSTGGVLVELVQRDA
jgi:methylmalonyl-CoA/ethylmalonyl-CoA epimerase